MVGGVWSNFRMPLKFLTDMLRRNEPREFLAGAGTMSDFPWKLPGPGLVPIV